MKARTARPLWGKIEKGLKQEAAELTRVGARDEAGEVFDALDDRLARKRENHAEWMQRRRLGTRPIDPRFAPRPRS